MNSPRDKNVYKKQDEYKTHTHNCEITRNKKKKHQQQQEQQQNNQLFNKLKTTTTTTRSKTLKENTDTQI